MYRQVLYFAKGQVFDIMSSTPAPTAVPTGGLLTAAANPGAAAGGAGTVNPPPHSGGAAPPGTPAGGAAGHGTGMIQPPPPPHAGQPILVAGGGAAPNPGGGGAPGHQIMAGGGGVPNLGAGAPLDPWEDLVASAPATRHQVAYQLIRLGRSTTWEDAIRPFRASKDRPANFNSLNLMGGYAASLGPVYLLVSVGGKIQLLYGLRHSYEVAGGGARVLGLMGEREKHGDVIIDPALYTLGGNIAGQAAHFGRVSVPAQTLVAIEAEYAANEALELVVGDATPNAAETATWKAFEVPARIAWAFAGGLTFRQATALMPRIVAATPAEFQADLEPLIDFVRVAATSDAHGHSTTMTTWEVIETRANAPLHLWYLQLLDQRAPRFTELPVETPAAPGPILDPVTFVNAVKEAAGPRGQESTATSKREYAEYERARIFKVVGQTANADGSFDGLTHDQVPELFKRLLACKSAGKARVLLEEWYKEHRPTDAPAYSIILSADFISCMRNLTFCGDDELIMHAKRQVGFSPFGLAPVNMADLEAASVRRASYLQFERTEDNHTPAHAAEMDALNHGPAKYPNTLEAFEKWLVCFIGTVSAFLTVTCDLVNPLRTLREKLYNPILFSGYTAKDYQGLAWMTHRSIRRFFRDGNTDMLRRIIADVEAERKHGEDCLPPEMRALPPAIISDTSSASGMSSISGSSESDREAKRQRKEERAPGAPYVHLFARDLLRAEEARNGERIMGKLLCPDGPALRKLFGDEFLRLLPPGASPCVRFYIMGGCLARFGCNLCHDTSRAVPQQVLQGIQKRVQERCDVLVRNAAKNA